MYLESNKRQLIRLGFAGFSRTEGRKKRKKRIFTGSTNVGKGGKALGRLSTMFAQKLRVAGNLDGKGPVELKKRFNQKSQKATIVNWGAKGGKVEANEKIELQQPSKHPGESRCKKSQKSS